jgi:hypothetical protein
MMDQSSRNEGKSRSWRAYGFYASIVVGAAIFAIFRSAGLAIFVAAALDLFTLWLNGLRHTAMQQMGELAVAQAHLQQGEDAAARRMSTDLAVRARVSRVRNSALTMAAWASLKEGNPKRAKEALDHVRPAHQIDLYCFAAVEDALGKSNLAIEALELDVFPKREAAMFLVDLYATQGRFDRALSAAAARRRVLGIDNCRQIVAAAVQAWALAPAARFAKTLFADTSAPEDAATLLRVLAHQREFDEVDRTMDLVVGRLISQGKLSGARSLLAELAADRALPSGACRNFAGKLRALEAA